MNEGGDEGSIGFHFLEVVAIEDIGGRGVEIEDAECGLDELLEDDGLDDLAGTDLVPLGDLSRFVESIFLDKWELEMV